MGVVWGFPVKLYNTKKPKPTDWLLLYVDTVEDATTDGYHDLTLHHRPVAYIFIKTVLENGEAMSLTASHELFEMVIDPIANLWAEGNGGWEYAYEMCDPVEEDTFKVDGLEMSKGLNHDHDGVRCPSGALPFPTLTRATTDSSNNMVSSIPSRAFWKLADISMPT